MQEFHNSAFKEVHTRCSAQMVAGSSRNDTEAVHTLWRQHWRQQLNQQPRTSEGGPDKEQRIQVMVVQPGNEVVIGTQLSLNSKRPATERKKPSDQEAAAKLVDEACSRDAAHQASSA